MYRGELVFHYIHDVGGEIRVGEALDILSDVAAVRTVEPTKSAPPYVDIVRPISLRSTERTVQTDVGARSVHVETRLYAIGAIAVALRVPFEAPDLRALNDLTHMKPESGATFSRIARDVAGELREKLLPALVETYEASVEAETYLTIVLTGTPLPAADLLATEARTIAGILAGERKPERLSQEEVSDNLRTWFSYYEDDLVVVDWERALVIEPTGKYDDVLSVIEAANLELLELRAYDRYLDAVLERSYDDLTRFYGRGGLFRSARGVQADLSNVRIDLVRVTDTINNIGKIFGDYYIAKLHVGLADRFHLSEWEAIVREKMATLNELYTLASHEVEHRRGMLLESMIVLLFIIDLVLIFIVSGK